MGRTFRGGTSSTAERHGITFVFQTPVAVSKFWNGDLCVPPGTVVTRIYPDWDGTRHGFMKNPTFSGASGGTQAHRADLGEYAGTPQTLPVTLAAGDRLVACLGKSGSVSPGGGGHGNDTVVVLTCLSFPAQADMFRPAYAGTGESVYTFRNFNLNLLPTITNPAGKNIPSFVIGPPTGGTDFIVKRGDELWAPLDLRYGNEVAVAPRYYMKNSQGANYYLSPSRQRPNYARDWCKEIGILSMKAMISHSEQVVSAYKVIQQGIDAEAEVASNLHAISGNGFLGFGWKWPILFKRILAGENETTLPFYCPNAPWTSNKKFQEDNYTRVVSGKARWGIPSGHSPLESYAGTNHVVLPSSGGDFDQYEMRIRYVALGENPNDEYRLASNYELITGNSGLLLHALAARKMNSNWLSQDTSFFAYCDRWGDMSLPNAVTTWRTTYPVQLATDPETAGGIDNYVGEFKIDINVYGGTGSGWAKNLWEQNR